MPTQPTTARRSRHTTAVSVLIGLLLLLIPAAATAQSSVESYDLGEATIVQSDFEADSRFHDMPVALQGVLAVPDGEGPFPVALIVHGAYEFCSTLIEEVDVYPCPPEDDLRQYEGFSYLAEALAARGYIAVIPDLSAEFNNGYGFPVFGERSVQIIEAHLDALEAGEGFDVDVAGKGDFSRLVIAGHSRGGPLAVRYITDDGTATRSASALALLAPAPLAPKAKIPATMPTALVIAQCDGDVGTKGPLQYRNKQLKPLRKTLTTYYTIPGGTHNAFSTQLGSDPSSPCKEEKLLAPEEQQAFASSFVPDFFDMALASGRLPVAE